MLFINGIDGNLGYFLIFETIYTYMILEQTPNVDSGRCPVKLILRYSLSKKRTPPLNPLCSVIKAGSSEPG
jgi:hypothetical protein